MPKSQAAKELAAKQKAQAKAEKERRKHSDNPKDWGTGKQLVETFKLTRQVDPQLLWWVIGSFVAGVVVFTVLGLILTDLWWAWLIVGIFAGAAAAMWVFQWRAKRSMYARFKGQTGSAEVALSLLDKKKWTSTPAIAFTRQQDVVHRAVGPGGIVLIGEGHGNGLRNLLATETKRHEQVAYGTPVTSIIMGDGKGQVPLEDLDKHIKKLPKALSTSQVDEVVNRLKALDAMRPKVPLPKGPMPNSMKGARAPCEDAEPPLAGTNIVNADRISKSWGTRTVLSKVSLGLSTGDVIGVVGRNGDGKSTS
ncbi:transmembrane protein [Cutibacterium acnes JCM 18920]|nr:transmembrane protein [Cutibacterium acnes JCM 18920]